MDEETRAPMQRLFDDWLEAARGVVCERSSNLNRDLLHLYKEAGVRAHELGLQLPAWAVEDRELHLEIPGILKKGERCL